MFAFEAEPLEGREPEIAEGDAMVVGGGWEVSLMFEPAAGEEDREVLVAVGRGIAHAAAHDDEGLVEELGFLESAEEPIDLGEDVIFDDFELRKFSFAFAVVRDAVVAQFDFVEIRDSETHGDFESGNAG